MTDPTPHQVSELTLIDAAPEPSELKSVAEKPEERERHSRCLHSGQQGPFAPISLLSNEGRCVQCISTICGPALCR